jgi:hypothetical protein
MMGGRESVEHQHPTRCVHAERIPERRDDERLIKGDPQRHAVGEPTRRDARKLGEPVCRVA